MKLLEAQVTLYKNIVDSTVVSFDEHVTALVGKNESGKTSFLRALFSLNPVPKDAVKFDVVNDYPRWRMKRDGRQSPLDEVAPVTALFVLSSDELAELSDLTDTQLPSNTCVRASRNYENCLDLTLELPNESEVIESLLASLDVDDTTLAELREATTLETLSSLTADTLSQLRQSKAVRKQTSPLSTLLGDIKQLQAVEEQELSAEVCIYLEQHLPQFFYFSDYSTLAGRIDLQDLLNKKQTGQKLSDSERTAVSLLSLVGVTGDELMATNFESRKAELEAAANDITQQVFEYWTQNQELVVELDVDSVAIPIAPNDQKVVHKYLDIRMRDLRHSMTTNFSTRSSGFQWFFSFVAGFSEYQSPNVIVLLDEPGLGLHGRAQGDLLRFMEERLAHEAQVVYTTHSPFMVDPAKLERVRLVEDNYSKSNPAQGSTISQDVLSVTGDTVFPLQAALGYDLAQNLFIGGYNLVVEGPADYIYLTSASRHLSGLKRMGLDPKWRIVPVGGIDKIPTFVALLGTHLDVTVLVDSRGAQHQKLSHLISQGILQQQRLISVGQVLEVSSADIEDMFTVHEYLKLYNAAFSQSVSVSKLPPGSTILQRLEQHQGAKFDHLLPALSLLSSQNDFWTTADASTVDHFERLFGLINATLPD